MQKRDYLIILVVVLMAPLWAQTGFENRPITNNVNMPTASTLNKGEFQLGIGPLAFGISDKVQIGTNVLEFIFGSANANLRVNVLNTADNAVAVGIGVGQTETTLYGRDVSYVAWYPFVAYSRPLSPTTLFHASLNLSAFTGDEDVQNADPRAFWRGTSIDAGVEYSYSNKTMFLGEAGYDFTFDGPRLSGAVLWGWKTFRLKLGLAVYNPAGNANAFVSPLLGLWWRFGGN